ncbi:MAG TPA: hypothetical protein VIV60_02100 [Polyangiaceae bacterium]
MLVIVHGISNPSQLEWGRLMNETAVRGRGTSLRMLIISHGGGPDVDQRKQLTKLMEESPAPRAIMTNSAVVRSIMAAIAFFNPQMRAFGLRELNEACAYLGLSAEERLTAARLRGVLESKLDLQARQDAH